MEGARTLALVAELALGVLGFTGIVAAPGHRESSEWTALDKRRFFSMGLIGALAVVLALLPFPLHCAGLQASSVWGRSGGLGAVLTISVAIGVGRTTPSGSPIAVDRDPEVNNAALGLGILVSYGSPLRFLPNASGLLLERAFAPYLLGALFTSSFPWSRSSAQLPRRPDARGARSEGGLNAENSRNRRPQNGFHVRWGRRDFSDLGRYDSRLDSIRGCAGGFGRIRRPPCEEGVQ
jgi:hypothetical protein